MKGIGTIFTKLFRNKKAPVNKNNNEEIISLPAGISGPMVGLVKAISMKPFPITRERFIRLRENADQPLLKALDTLEPSNEIMPSHLAVVLTNELGDKAIPHLMKLIGCEDRDVGRIAGDACVALGQRVVPHLQKYLKGDNIESRNDAAAALLRMAANGVGSMPKEVIIGLRDIIRQVDLGRFDVITIAAAALGEIGANAVPVLKELLLDDSYLVRLGAVTGFLRSGGENALSTLQEARKRETNFTVAEAIDHAIEIIVEDMK